MLVHLAMDIVCVCDLLAVTALVIVTSWLTGLVVVNRVQCTC